MGNALANRFDDPRHFLSRRMRQGRLHLIAPERYQRVDIAHPAGRHPDENLPWPGDRPIGLLQAIAIKGLKALCDSSFHVWSPFGKGAVPGLSKHAGSGLGQTRP